MSVVIIGAGMAGLTAATLLADAGLDVVVLDKGRAVGGRMASKRIGEARFDHGAQHFSVRTQSFESMLARHRQSYEVWFSSESVTDPDRGVEPRHRGAPAMRSLCEAMAEGLDIRTAAFVDRVESGAVHVGDEVLPADEIVVTAPIPQLLAMVPGLDPATVQTLSSISYEPCIAVMATMSGPTGLVDGHLAAGDPIAWLADNHQKGVSRVPAVTAHSSTAYAVSQLESGQEQWLADLVPVIEDFTGAGVESAVAHRWRYSMPEHPLDVGAMRLLEGVWAAGEAFAGARVEGAHLSGAAVAERILDR